MKIGDHVRLPSGARGVLVAPCDAPPHAGKWWCVRLLVLSSGASLRHEAETTAPEASLTVANAECSCEARCISADEHACKLAVALGMHRQAICQWCREERARAYFDGLTRRLGMRWHADDIDSHQMRAAIEAFGDRVYDEGRAAWRRAGYRFGEDLKPGERPYKERHK